MNTITPIDQNQIAVVEAIKDLPIAQNESVVTVGAHEIAYLVQQIQRTDEAIALTGNMYLHAVRAKLQDRLLKWLEAFGLTPAMRVTLLYRLGVTKALA